MAATSKGKSRDRRHIMLRVVAATLDSGERVAALVARFATDKRLLKQRGYRVGDELRAELSKPRILGQHRKAHLLGALCVEHLPGFECEDSHSAIKRLQRDAGICCEPVSMEAKALVDALLTAAQSVLGEAATGVLRSVLYAVLPAIRTVQVMQPRSLAFDRMEQGEFEQFYRGLCVYLCDTYWPSSTPAVVEAMAELMDRQVAA